LKDVAAAAGERRPYAETGDEQMSKREPPIDDAHARELLRRERERIESSLADLDRVRGSELDEIQTSTDPADDAELI
jgi:hypothetical protein